MRAGRARALVAGAGVVVVGVVVGIGVLARGGGADEAPAVRVVDVYLGQADGSTASAYLTLANDGGDDALVGVSSPVADQVELHTTERRDGLDVMVPADALDVPAGGELRLEPFGAHLMLVGLDAPLEPGGTVALELSFRRSAPLSVEGPVLSYDDVLARLGDAR